MNYAKHERAKFITQICKQYYHNHLSQNEIADRFGISRSYVSKLLKDAEKMGIVTIHISDSFGDETPIETEIKQKFNLTHAFVIPFHIEDRESRIRVLGEHLGRFLASIIEDGDIVGVAWGRTMFVCSQNLLKKHTKNSSIVQLNGGLCYYNSNVPVDEVYLNFASAYDATPYFLRVPAFVDSEEIRNSICSDSSIAKVLDIGERSNIIVYAVGEFRADSSLVNMNYFSPEEYRKLIEQGIVCDMLSHLLNIHGEVVKTKYEKRSVTIPAELMKQKPYRILVAAQRQVVYGIYATLVGGFPNVLITDETTAKELLSFDPGSLNM